MFAARRDFDERAGAAAGPVIEWKRKTVGLRYSLSYVKVFEARFEALEDGRPFDPRRPAVQQPAPPLPEVPAGYDVIVSRHELLQAKIAAIERLPNLLRYAPRQLPHYYTDLRGGPERAFRAMSAKTRSTLKRKVRHFEAFCGGALDWRVYRTPEEVQLFFALAKDLVRKTYQQRLFESGLPDTADFRNQALALARRDAVRAFLLFYGGKPAAYLYTAAPDGFLVYEYLGYDPEYAEHSPGTVLQYLALEMLFAEQRFPLYYWGYGYSQTKKVFSTGEVLGADVYYFRPTARNVAAVRLHEASDRFAAGVGKLLERVNLKQAIRRWLKRG
jgi:CelD/BcsL family acetyltransferase involved in cellulose biosynthesis